MQHDRRISFTGPIGARSREGAELIVVSNRLPPRVEVGRKQRVGGLVSALGAALAARRSVWLGSGDADASGEVLAIDDDDDGGSGRAELRLPADLYRPYYDGFCNGVLWPFLHGMVSRVSYDDDAWRAYAEVNERFADAVLQLAAPDSTVWIHDYHLMLAARALRRRGFTGRLGFFLHVPFPATEVVETLPRGEEILEGLLSFDLAGFHTPRYVRNFSEAACDLVGARAHAASLSRGGRVCRVGVFPIGIDPDLFAEAGDADPDDELKNLARMLDTRRMVVGVDRLDYTKGIVERLAGFERLLQAKPEWRGRVVLIQIAVPSREEVPDYVEQRARIESMVGRINGEYGETDWVPVRYLYRSYAPRDVARLYRMADVALVTPLRDGMNLVAKEFVAAQDAEHPGVLVLSRFAGAAVELQRAVLTNPLHPDGLARDLDRALRMPLEERRSRHADLLAAVRGHTAADWSNAFLAALECEGVRCADAPVRRCANADD